MDKFQKVDTLIAKAREAARHTNAEIAEHIAMENVDITPVTQEAIGPADPDKTHRGYIQAEK